VSFRHSNQQHFTPEEGDEDGDETVTEGSVSFSALCCTESANSTGWFPCNGGPGR
jgi:hypothetical protein